MNRSIQEKTEMIAIVGSTPELNGTEKNWMETTNLKFFEKEAVAVSWF